MPVLTTLDKDRARSHLGYDIYAAVPAFAESRFQEAAANVFSDYAYRGNPGGILYWLDRCDSLLLASDPASTDAFLQKQLIVGDVNRATTTVRSRDIDYWWELYLQATDQLAFKLNVPNFRRPENMAYMWTNFAESVVQGLPGPPDSCVSDRLWLSRNYA